MSSSNWKTLGLNSGNMVNHRNVAANKLNYEDGKWRSIYDSNGNKKIVHDCSNTVTNQNVVVGIGTATPFSRLSLGANIGDGSNNNIGIVGQVASIAVRENSDGSGFHGLSYVTNVNGLVEAILSDSKTNALALYSNPSSISMSLDNSGIFIGENNVVSIGGTPRYPAVAAGLCSARARDSLDH